MRQFATPLVRKRPALRHVSDLEVVLWSLSWSAVSRLTLRFSRAERGPSTFVAE
jgi:hypothetical protein